MVRRRKVALHTISHLTPTEAWRSPDSTTSEGRRVSSEVWLGNCKQVWGVGQIWRAWDSRLRKNSTSPLFWLVQTSPDLCTQYSDHVGSYSNVIFCTFERSYSSVLRPILVKLHILTRLIDSFPLPYCPKSWDKEKLSISLEAHHNAQSSEIFLSFPPKNWKSCNF